MKTAILNNQSLLSRLNLTTTIEKPCATSSSHCYILDLYGADALKPRYLSFQAPGGGEEIVLVPKMRYEMGEEAWEGLSLELRGEVLRLFYEGV